MLGILCAIFVGTREAQASFFSAISQFFTKNAVTASVATAFSDSNIQQVHASATKNVSTNDERDSAIDAGVQDLFSPENDPVLTSDNTLEASLDDGTSSLTSQNIDILDPNNVEVAQYHVSMEEIEGGALVAQDNFSEINPTAALITTYVVREGDTISSIAAMFRVSANTIIWANGLSKSTIRTGQELVILPVNGITHIVKSGETLGQIAKKYNGNVDEIIAFNNIEGDVKAGEEIVIPDGEPEKAHQTTTVVKKSTLKETKGYFSNPLPGGKRTQGIHGNNAVDIAAKSGTPVVAAADGNVIIVRSDGGWNGGYGNYVVIAHKNGTQTLYSHLSSVSVAQGEAVSQGEKIGGVGTTGKSTGPHLHFEVRGGKNPF